MIRPRTKSEREAYIEGYARALNDVHDHDFETAQGFLRLIVDVERSTDDPEAERNSVGHPAD